MMQSRSPDDAKWDELLGSMGPKEFERLDALFNGDENMETREPTPDYMLNIAVARLLGWKPCENEMLNGMWEHDGELREGLFCTYRDQHDDILAKVKRDGLRVLFSYHLYKEIACTPYSSEFLPFHIISAQPRTIVIAFLKTYGAWEESWVA